MTHSRRCLSTPGDDLNPLMERDIDACVGGGSLTYITLERLTAARCYIKIFWQRLFYSFVFVGFFEIAPCMHLTHSRVCQSNIIKFIFKARDFFVREWRLLLDSHHDDEYVEYPAVAVAIKHLVMMKQVYAPRLGLRFRRAHVMSVWRIQLYNGNFLI